MVAAIQKWRTWYSAEPWFCLRFAVIQYLSSVCLPTGLHVQGWRNFGVQSLVEDPRKALDIARRVIYPSRRPLPDHYTGFWCVSTRGAFLITTIIINAHWWVFQKWYLLKGNVLGSCCLGCLILKGFTPYYHKNWDLYLFLKKTKPLRQESEVFCSIIVSPLSAMIL